MAHKIRSVMGQRDSRYRLSGVAELDEARFTTEDGREEDEPLKRGNGSQHKAKVLVMVESEPVEDPKKGQKDRRAGHMRMAVVENLGAHAAISNAKAVFADMYHGIKREFLQLYLDEFCYKFNRRLFGERLFERLMIAAVCIRPSFVHRLYGSTPYCGQSLKNVKR